MKKENIAALVNTMVGVFLGIMGMRMLKKTKSKPASKEGKFKNYYNMLNQWLALKQNGRGLEEYFVKYGYGTIAVYGMGEMGIRLYDELENTSINILYAIDREPGNAYSEVPVYTMEDSVEKVDIIVVSAVFDFDVIYNKLKHKVNCPIISLSQIIYELNDNLS